MSQFGSSLESLTNSKRFCILPWTHIHLSPNGNIYSCCRSDFKEALGSFHTHTLKEVWNNPQMRQLRLKMLQEVYIENCHDCYQQEEKGIQSMRQHSNRDWKDYLNLINETTADGTLKIFSPVYLDLRFDNICNFKCRTCGPDFSTSWYSDCKDLGMTIDTKIHKASLDEAKMWVELFEIIDSVKRIYFAGGEPLIENDHYILLDHLISQNKKSTTLTYNTNFSQLSFKNKSIIDYWNKFEDVWVHASIDGIEKKGEYVRKGMSWENIYQNRLTLKKEAPHVKFTIYWTLSLLNAFHLIEALQFFAEHEFITDWEMFAVNILNAPEIYNIRLFNQHERDQLRHIYVNFINNYLPLSTLKNGSHIVAQLQYVLSYLDEENWEEKRKLFWAFNRKLDKIRKENFLQLFPELKTLYEIPFSEQNKIK